VLGGVARTRKPRDAGSRRLLGKRPGALHMHRLEAHAALLDIRGDDVDDGVDPGYGMETTGS
jgi:hypothetical protein